MASLSAQSEDEVIHDDIPLTSELLLKNEANFMQTMQKDAIMKQVFKN